MLYRAVTIFSGKTFQVPQYIRRIDHRATHGWQLRYGKWTMFSDFSNDGSGAKAALALATEELLRRVDKLPAPSGLRRDASASKTNDLPVGISGPIVRTRAGRAVAECSFGVSIPRFGMKPTNKNVYIATQNTYSQEKFDIALAKAIELRSNAQKAYQSAATKAKRATSRKRERA
ncbi:MAG TPA: hypothetical protein VJ598_00750 [Albitalea sp.]|nr:hypothetical protein [Albitalea sp.]